MVCFYTSARSAGHGVRSAMASVCGQASSAAGTVPRIGRDMPCRESGFMYRVIQNLHPQVHEKESTVSTDFCPLKPIKMVEVFDGRLERFGIREHQPEESSKTTRLLTDGRNYLLVDCGEDGLVTGFTRRAWCNAPQQILEAISNEFNVQIVSEYEPEFWGYETQAELDAAMDLMAKESERKFYEQVEKFIRGETHDINPGTVGMIQAEIAKDLVARNPELLFADNRKHLIQAVEAIYDRDHAIKVTLTDEDMALVRMIATHEDDLPRA
jgi:hypothetical protein